MARVRLGDIVPLYVPPGSEADVTPMYPRVPAYPLDLAGNFVTSSFSARGTVPPYAADEGSQPYDTEVTGGPIFVGSQPNIPAPFSNPAYAPLQARRNPYARTALLKHSQLPPSLQRQSQVLTAGRDLFRPTAWDLKILKESAMWRWIAEHGGLKSCCRIPEMGAPVWSIPPWIERPSNGIDFRDMFFQPLSAFQTLGVFNGLDVALGRFRVDLGYNGVIRKVVFGFTGDGHQEGSGDIVWRLKVGQRYARDFGKVVNTYGSLQTALLVEDEHIDLVSGQDVILIANIPGGSPVTNGEVFGGVFGWQWPVR